MMNRWWMQKLDEIFETIMILAIFHSFDSKQQFMRLHIITSVIGIIFIPSWFCELHLIGIALLSFVQLNSLGWSLLHKCDKQLHRELFGWIRNYFMIAGVSWLIDRIACGYLHNLPLSIPNPQLHAFGWHLFCSLGLNQTMIAVCILHKINKSAKHVRLINFLKLFPLTLSLVKLVTNSWKRGHHVNSAWHWHFSEEFVFYCLCCRNSF